MTELAPKQITYCGVCTWPLEFCEFGISLPRCQSWLASKHPELFSTVYPNTPNPESVSASAPSADELASKLELATLSSDPKEAKIQAELLKKQAKHQLKQEKELTKKQNSKIIIKRIERNKRKHIISISGLEVFQIEPKKLAKTFASKFATGASVVKNAEKLDEVVVQGDVSDEAKEYIEKLLKEQEGLENVKVEQVDDKKIKKKQEAAAEAAAKVKK